MTRKVNFNVFYQKQILIIQKKLLERLLWKLISILLNIDVVISKYFENQSLIINYKLYNHFLKIIDEAKK